MGSLDNKIAVITGGTRGFGLAIARAYAKEGAAVVIGSRSEGSVSQAVALLSAEGAQASGIVCDIAVPQTIQALAEHAIRLFDRFDIWVNNAAVSAPYGPTVLIPEEYFLQTLQTDITGVYHGSLIAMRHFLPRKSGKLINILGRGDNQPVPMQNAYASSKAWVRQFTIALAKEYQDSGVGVYAFNPGLMDTELMNKLEVISGYEEKIKPLGMVMRLWSKPTEVPAQRALWLASSATDGRTGLVIRQLGPLQLLAGVLQVSFQRILRRSPGEYKPDILSIPPATM